MVKPYRVQRKRSAGWRLPEGAVIVDRTSKWGNPFRISESDQVDVWEVSDGRGMQGTVRGRLAAHEMAVALFRGVLVSGNKQEQLKWLGYTAAEVRVELAGKPLACWCGLDEPCHADVLLMVANPGFAQL